MKGRFQPTTVGNMVHDQNGGYVCYWDYEELASLVRECRKAIDELLEKRPMQAAMLCGSTTLGNLLVDLNRVVNGMTPNAIVTGLPPAQTAELPPKPAGGRSELT